MVGKSKTGNPATTSKARLRLFACSPLNPKKDEMIMRLWSLFNDGRIEIPKDDDLLVELNGLQTTQTSGGLNKYEHVRGQHDDLVWSLSMSCFEEDSRWSMAFDVGMECGQSESDEAVKDMERKIWFHNHYSVKEAGMFLRLGTNSLYYG